MTAQFFPDAARALERDGDGVASELAALVADWSKWAAAYAADPAGFAAAETRSLVDYLARWLANGDADYLNLYIGEKAKQFHEPGVPFGTHAAREAALLAAERAIFRARVAGAAAAAVDTFFDAVDQALTGTHEAVAKLLFVGDCLFQDVLAFLIGPALADGVRIDASFVVAHDPVGQQAEIARVADERFDAVFLSPFTYTMLASYAELQQPRVALAPGAVRPRIAAAGDAAERLLDTLADLFDCPIFIHAPAPVMRHEQGLRERARTALAAPALARAGRALSARVRAAAARRNAQGARVRVIDEQALVAPIGLEAAGRYLHRTAMQHPARFGALVAACYRDPVLVVARLLKRKLVACDLDNTLWEGVIGEGLGVRHHLDRHATLRDLKARGVVLAINSKNDPAKVVWDGAGLVADDFVSSQINWDPKPLNVRRIAAHLNLKEKDFVFIDDRADERALVAKQCAGVLPLDALDPRSWRLLALWHDLLPDKADADRTDFYRQRDARQAFLAAEQETSDQQRAELYAGLGLTLALREAQVADLARVTDLVNRTNQFNMTAARLTARQTQAYADSADARILVADAGDRFGTMGTIAVLIAERREGVIDIPAFVLSCRVFGYGMEFAILEAARRLAAPGEALAGQLVETQFNQPCRPVYGEAGFAEEAPGQWSLGEAASARIAVPAWLAVDDAIAPFAARRAAA